MSEAPGPVAGWGRPAAAPLARGLAIGLVLALVAAGAVLAHAALFGNFSTWDDEGYFLLALRAWKEGGGLYDRIDTIYGPFYFQAVAGISWLVRIPLDNVGARWIVLAIWTVSAFHVLLHAWKAARSLFAALLAWALAFPFLMVLANEPLHPGGLVALLLPPLALLSRRLASEEERPGTWAALGALTAAIALTKLNVGAFALLAGMGLCLRFSTRSALMLAARALFGALLVAFPFLLMRPLLATRWVSEFALLSSLSLFPFALMLFLPPCERPWSRRSLAAFAAGGLALAAISFGICFATGTTLPWMWRALVLDALRFPASTKLAPLLPSLTEILAPLVLVPLALLLRRERRLWARSAFALLKIGGSAWMLVQCVRLEVPLATLPFLWLVALPREGSSRAHAPTYYLALLVALQALHMYPVAGSQTGFFAFLVPLAAVLGLWEGWSDLPDVWKARIPHGLSTWWPAPAAAAGIGLLASFNAGWRALPIRLERYRHESVRLGLPGAESLRLPEWQATAYRWLAANLRRHGDTFLALPGLHSLYLWTEEQPPVPFYSHVWPLSYDEERQRRLGESLFAREGACVVRNMGVLEKWLRGEPAPDSPLARAIDERFKVAGEAWGFELLIPKGKKRDLVLSAMRAEVPASVPQAWADRVALRLALPEMPGARLARFALVHVESGSVLCDSSAPRLEDRLVVADERGEMPSAEDGRFVPISLDAGHAVLALCPASVRQQRGGTFLVRCFDEPGEVVARLPVVR